MLVQCLKNHYSEKRLLFTIHLAKIPLHIKNTQKQVVSKNSIQASTTNSINEKFFSLGVKSNVILSNISSSSLGVVKCIASFSLAEKSDVRNT